MKPVIIIIFTVVCLVVPVSTYADLNDLKKLIPDDYIITFDNVMYDDPIVNTIFAKIEKDNVKTGIMIHQILDSSDKSDEVKLWDLFKYYRIGLQNEKQLMDLPASCYDGWKEEYVRFTICIKEDTIVIVTSDNELHPQKDTIPIMKQILNKISGESSLAKIIEIKNPNSGGCLIATATYGSELAPQVQQLRELRDNQLLQTTSGTSFMKSFNEFYYSFSPTIADWERESPVFKEAVKITLTPMISSLSILNHVDLDSEAKVLGYGISLILLNVGIYFVAPTVVIHSIRKKF